MNYFPPKTFLKFGTVKRSTWRIGAFTIDSVNDQYNSEHYWITSRENDNGKFTTSYYHNDKDIFKSPEYDTEEQAIAWLEGSLRALSFKKINEANAKLRTQIKENNGWLKNLK